MKRINFSRLQYLIISGKRRHQKAFLRKQRKHKLKVGFLKFQEDVRLNSIKNGKSFKKSKEIGLRARSYGIKPIYNATIKYLAEKKESFSKVELSKKDDGYFVIPEVFSLYENYSNSFDFLKRLFYVLYNQSASKITFDYSSCRRIDIDASVCMDILLGEFIHYFHQCNNAKYPIKVEKITPINFERDEIKKILFSIGAFSNIKGVRIKYPDIIPYPLKFSVINHPAAPKIREVHITEMVDYVIRCMHKMKRQLTPEAEKNLFEVIGEALINAEEHSSGDKRFAIGYFQESDNNGQHIGIFNLAILNFGNTIYEKFKDPDCPNKAVVKVMEDLSSKYTKGGFFTKAEFEEQTLWTLYALQEGVTSKADWRRGNGSIRFIDSFFNLKGDNERDEISYLSIVSGNTRIIFDGSYRLIEKIKGEKKQTFKMMTFNSNGDIEAKPDKKYVTFVENYFPGTIISAKICIKEIDTQISL